LKGGVGEEGYEGRGRAIELEADGLREGQGKGEEDRGG